MVTADDVNVARFDRSQQSLPVGFIPVQYVWTAWPGQQKQHLSAADSAKHIHTAWHGTFQLITHPAFVLLTILPWLPVAAYLTDLFCIPDWWCTFESSVPICDLLSIEQQVLRTRLNRYRQTPLQCLRSKQESRLAMALSGTLLLLWAGCLALSTNQPALMCFHYTAICPA